LEAHDKFLVSFLREKHILKIPLYQRTYSWKKDNCKQLWLDIIKVAKNENTDYHFIGSIVRVGKKNDSSERPQKLIIDGQQRVTSVLLLICALIENVKDSNSTRALEWKEEFLINRNTSSEDEKYKLLLTKQDKESFIAIVEGNKNTEIQSKHIKDNFDFFKNSIKQFIATEKDYELIIQGIRKLRIVDIQLEENYDNPQIIFESLNSTGLALSQSDLIRNYILMNLTAEKQDYLYQNYWYEIEKLFGQVYYNDYFDSFIRDFLTIKYNGNIPNIANVYAVFKKVYNFAENKTLSNEEILKDVYCFARYFVKMKFEKEIDCELKQAFFYINELKVDVAYPFLLCVYDDFSNEIINKSEFLQILKMVEGYVFRRFVCDMKTNALNKVFANLYKSIDKNNYVESFYLALNQLKTYKRFPKNDEFREQLLIRDFYNIKNKTFWLFRVENFERKEKINPIEYTVEHIMPQKITPKWQQMLGDVDEYTYDKYLHRLGNLTLTGYNSEMGNKSFLEKKQAGFNESPLKLNEYLRKVETWNLREIENRGELLADLMLRIWEFPIVDSNLLTNIEKKKESYSIEDHPALLNGEMKEIFEILNTNIENISDEVERVF